MNEPDMKKSARAAVGCSGWLCRLDDIFDTAATEIGTYYLEARRRVRLFRLRCFFSFCEFAVSCYGSKYILKAALIAAHLFENLQNLGRFHLHNAKAQPQPPPATGAEEKNP